MNFSNDLLENINKLHTTELGIIRIRKNLNLDTDDVVQWCKNKITDSNDYSHVKALVVADICTTSIA